MATAPGRVNLIGEHTDYNGGFVLPMAIERRTVLAAAPADRSEPAIRLHSENLRAGAEFPMDPSALWGGPAWANYVRGVFIECARIGMATPALDVVINSDVPLGGGLSSSAALEVAAATLIEAVTGRRMPVLEKALLCQKAEHEYAHMPCGIMDQYIAAAAREGELLLLDCRSLEARYVPLRDHAVSVLILDSRVKHELAGGEYAKRRADCEQAASILGAKSLREADGAMLEAAQGSLGDALYRRARHVISENERTLAAAAAIEAGDWPAAGRLMNDSHASLREDYEVSCAEVDLLVNLAQELGPADGVYGARMTGGGFGGCTVNLVRTAEAERIARAVCEAYHAKTGLEAAAFVTRPAQGAREILV